MYRLVPVNMLLPALALILLTCCDDAALQADFTLDVSVIPSYPGAQEFCSGHVIERPGPEGVPGAHIQWTAYHTNDTITQVRRFYEAPLGPARDDVEDEAHWSIPTERPTRAVSIHRADGDGPWKASCEAPSTSGTVVVLSTMARAD